MSSRIFGIAELGRMDLSMHNLYNDYDGYGAMVAIWLVLLPIIFIFAVAGYVIGAFFLMKVFEKAGVQGKWRAWVPVYNVLVFAKLGDLSPWVMLGAVVASSLLGQIPAIGWIFSLLSVAAGVIAAWRVGHKFGRDWPYLLLFLIPGVGGLIWLGILAFGNHVWNPNIAPAPWRDSFLKDTTVWQGIPVQPGAPVGPAGPGAQPAAGYQAPPAPGAYPPPPAGYQPPPAGYQPPTAPPVAQPPVTPPPVTPPPAAQPPVTPPTTEPPAPDAPRV